jgi:predicted amidohydrolase YtcJ
VKFAEVLILLTLLGCTVLSQGRAADLVIVNGDIRTMAEKTPRAEALAVVDGRIVAVGKNEDIRKRIGEATKVVDAGGRLVLPGFNDAHVHFMAIGNLFSSLDLRRARSGEESARAIERFAQFLPEGRWILGSGWDSENWMPASPPDRGLIDAATPLNPVLLYNAKPDTAFVNSVALKLAGITAKSADPPGGEIVRRADGEPTGVIKGSAIGLVSRLVPPDHTRRWDELAAAASNYAASLGVTSVQDTHSDDMAAVYLKLEAAGKLKTRVYDCVELTAANIEKYSADRGRGMARRGCLKSFAELDEGWSATLKELVRSADKAGHQVAIHAIGSLANANAIGILADVQSGNKTRGRRHRLEHAEGITEEDRERLRGLGVIASIQPYLFGRGAADTEYYRSLQAAGVELALGSDAPMTEFDPLLGIRAMMRGSEGTASIENALRAYTLGSAFAEFQESEKGTLESGKLADIVILSENIVSDPGRLDAARVVLTIVGGRVVYDAGTLQIQNNRKAAAER